MLKSLDFCQLNRKTLLCESSVVFCMVDLRTLGSHGTDVLYGGGRECLCRCSLALASHSDVRFDPYFLRISFVSKLFGFLSSCSSSLSFSISNFFKLIFRLRFSAANDLLRVLSS